ncbi:carboxypeptidase family protein [Neolewinella xylanilytica]|uniref:Carboxypeptidase family protein n=1 Tax=Neolewinella xylanilytica TaxID=1514080 RepID=A0A2S6I2S5_9BACT|nr:carboxypeptidase-like regulatory domain-containing protein [Neolewinella xylanilytica]PPK85484.1 carboxypeptidase family protein [Neolewinella xylanilytica]
MLPTEYRDEELLHRWISGAITAPEEAELERRAAADPALHEALSGYQATPEEDHVARVSAMTARGRPTAARPTLFARYAAAATVLVLLGIAALLLPRYFDAPEPAIAMERTQPTLPDRPAASPENTAPAPPPPAPHAASPSEPDATTSIARRESVEAEVPAPDEAESAPEALPDAEMPTPAAEQELPQLQRNRPAPAPTLAAPPAPEPVAQPLRRLAIATPPQPVSGRVTDEDGNPIAEAEVYRLGQPLGTRTDSTGTFRIPYDATLSQIVVTHPNYEEETVEVFDTGALLQISMNEVPERPRFRTWTETASVSEVPLEANRAPRPQARPEEGYRELRRRIENERPATVPAGKVKVSFLVQEDGSLTDFRFRGQPNGATMDYVGKALVESSTWQVVRGESPVRVYFTLRFE